MTPDDPNAPFASHERALARAEQGVAELGAARRDRWYPAYHVASPGGWINDHNGLCHFNGRWHAFFQLHPFGTQWGPMNWGHASSADLAHWRPEPVALAPSLVAERAGVYSVSTVVDDSGQLCVLYTAHRWRNGHNEDEGNLEVQCLATSTDGIRFEKCGVVVDNPDGLRDFRDPKVWRQDGRWQMVVGRRAADDREEIVLFGSSDLRRWDYEGVLYRHPDEHAYMLECPDLFELALADGTRRWVLCFSAMGAQLRGYRFRNFNNAGYLVGTWRPGEPFVPEGDFQPLDWGQNFYAPQTFEAPGGRRILMGWMSPNGGALPNQVDGWCGQLTVPRELSLGSNGTLRCVPASELEALWGRRARRTRLSWDPTRSSRSRRPWGRGGSTSRSTSAPRRRSAAASRRTPPRTAASPTWPLTTRPGASCSTARPRASASAATARRRSPRARSRAECCGCAFFSTAARWRSLWETASRC